VLDAALQGKDAKAAKVAKAANFFVISPLLSRQVG